MGCGPHSHTSLECFWGPVSLWASATMCACMSGNASPPRLISLAGPVCVSNKVLQVISMDTLNLVCRNFVRG